MQGSDMRGVILVSDKKARLKPCLRCGYSLLRIAGAKNCPECGLAVRVSLGGNSALEWSNPRWQRIIALGFAILALGMVCRLVSLASYFAFVLEDYDYVQLGKITLRSIGWISRYAGEAEAIVCGLALCLLAKGERRYPDRSRAARGMALGAGLLLIAFGLLRVLLRHELIWSVFAWRLLWRALDGPWVPVVISVLVCAYALDISKRGRSQFLRRVSQAPLWPAAVGVFVWLLNLDRPAWHVSSIIQNAAFPLTMIVVLVVAVRVLLSGAREAELNWVTDP